MPAEDEFRKVAEDVRALARSLRQELRQAQNDARGAARQARTDFRREYQTFKHHRPRPGYYSGWKPPSARTDRAEQTDARPVQVAPRPVRPPRPPRPKRPPYRHTHDGSTLFSILLVMVGLAWLAAQTKIWNISAEAMLAAALAVLGAGMVITARTDWSLSRRHWPWWVGAGLLVILIGNAANVGDGLSSLSFGPVNFAPTAWADANRTVHNFAGPITIDLRNLQAGSDDETLTADDTFGPVRLELPGTPNFRVHITTHTVFGPHDSGTHDVGTTGPLLTINLRTVAGPVELPQQVSG